MEYLDGNGKMLTRKQVADFIGVSVKTIARWGQKGWLPSTKIGRLVRYYPGDVNRLIKDLYSNGN